MFAPYCRISGIVEKMNQKASQVLVNFQNTVLSPPYKLQKTSIRTYFWSVHEGDVCFLGKTKMKEAVQSQIESIKSTLI